MPSSRSGVRRELKTAIDKGNILDMSTLTIKLDDDAARLVAEAARAVNQPLEDWLRESICQAAERTVQNSKPGVNRIYPLHPSAMQPTSDFNAPLEEFDPYV
jgi:hypothetical protein